MNSRMSEALQKCNGSFVELNLTDNSTANLVKQFGYSQVWTSLKKTRAGFKWLDGSQADVTVIRGKSKIDTISLRIPIDIYQSQHR